MHNNFFTIIFRKKVKIVLFVTIVLVILYPILFLTKNSRAEEIVFFPSDCQGTWLNSETVSDDPNNSEVVSGAQTKAVGDTITCQSFDGDLPEDAVIKTAQLEFIWSTAEEEIKVPETPSIEESYDPKGVGKTESIISGSIIPEATGVTEKENIENKNVPSLEDKTDNTESTTREKVPASNSEVESAPESEASPLEPTSFLPKWLRSISGAIAQAKELPEPENNNEPITSTVTPESESELISPTETISPTISPVEDINPVVSNEENTSVENTSATEIFDVSYQIANQGPQSIGTLVREQLGAIKDLPLQAEDLESLKVSLTTRLTLEPLDSLVLQGIKLIITYENGNSDDPIKQPNLREDTILDEAESNGVKVIHIKRANSKATEIWYQVNKETSVITDQIKTNQEAIVTDTEKLVITDGQKALISATDKIEISATEKITITDTEKIVPEKNKVKTTRRSYWNLVAPTALVNEHSPLGLHDGVIFWINKEETALYSFNIANQGLNSQSYEPENGNNYIIYTGSSFAEKKAIFDSVSKIFDFQE